MKYRNKAGAWRCSASIYWCLVAFLLSVASFGTLRAQQLKVEGAAGASSQAAAAQESGPNAITRAVVQRGMLSCAARVEQVTRFLGFGSQSGAHLMPPPAPVDQRIFSLQMEMPTGAAGNSFVDMSFAPQQANGCGATYQSVTYWAQSCELVGSQQFANFKPSPALQRDVTVLDIGPQTKVFLMKTGLTGCISIKKEVVS